MLNYIKSLFTVNTVQVKREEPKVKKLTANDIELTNKFLTLNKDKIVKEAILLFVNSNFYTYFNQIRKIVNRKSVDKPEKLFSALNNNKIDENMLNELLTNKSLYEDMCFEVYAHSYTSKLCNYKEQEKILALINVAIDILQKNDKIISEIISDTELVHQFRSENMNSNEYINTFSALISAIKSTPINIIWEILTEDDYSESIIRLHVNRFFSTFNTNHSFSILENKLATLFFSEVISIVQHFITVNGKYDDRKSKEENKQRAEKCFRLINDVKAIVQKILLEINGRREIENLVTEDTEEMYYSLNQNSPLQNLIDAENVKMFYKQIKMLDNLDREVVSN